MTPEKHEALCRKCAECCRHKVILDNKYAIMLDIYCPALDPVTKLCMIYDIRHTPKGFELLGNRPCYTPEQAMKVDIFPTACPYTPRGYKGCHFSQNLVDKFKRGYPDIYGKMRFEVEVRRKVIRNYLKEKK